MTVTVAVLRERAPGERRLALVPALVAKYAAHGARILLEAGAGDAAGLPDSVSKAWKSSARTRWRAPTSSCACNRRRPT